MLIAFITSVAKRIAFDFKIEVLVWWSHLKRFLLQSRVSIISFYIFSLLEGGSFRKHVLMFY